MTDEHYRHFGERFIAACNEMLWQTRASYVALKQPPLHVTHAVSSRDVPMHFIAFSVLYQY